MHFQAARLKGCKCIRFEVVFRLAFESVFLIGWYGLSASLVAQGAREFCFILCRMLLRETGDECKNFPVLMLCPKFSETQS